MGNKCIMYEFTNDYLDSIKNFIVIISMIPKKRNGMPSRLVAGGYAALFGGIGHIVSIDTDNGASTATGNSFQ